MGISRTASMLEMLAVTAKFANIAELSRMEFSLVRFWAKRCKEYIKEMNK
jgi:hypothetical protein